MGKKKTVPFQVEDEQGKIKKSFIMNTPEVAKSDAHT